MKKLFASLLFLVVLLPTMALAADFRMDNISSNENVKDLYIAGQTVNVNSNVSDDLNAAGSTVNINGNVTGSSQAAGSSINQKGNVDGSSRYAGGTVNVDGNVNHDLVVFAGELNLANNSIVTGDVVVAGGTVNLNGQVKGRVQGMVGNLNINGTVDGDVDLRDVGKVVLGSNAVINGKLKYSSNEQSNINESQVKGGIEFTKVNRTEEKNAGKALLGFSIIGIIGSFLLLLALTKLFPLSTERFLASSFQNPWLNMLLGFVVLIVVPVVLVMLLVTVVGMPFAGIGFIIYLLLLVLAGLFSGLVAGSWLVKVFNKTDNYEYGWLPILVGVIVVTVLKYIPIFGWIIVFLLFLMSLGTLSKMLFGVSRDQMGR